MPFVQNENAQSLIYANYLDLNSDVKPYLQIDFTYTKADTRLQMFIDLACQWVQNFIGRPVAPTTYNRRFNGWTGFNGAYIELPYYPILEVTSVTEWRGASSYPIVESTPEYQVDGYQVDYLRGMLIRIFPGNVQKPWFPGSRNIEVSWVAGYNPTPADIKLATLEYVAHWFKNTQQQSGNRTGGAQMDYDSGEIGIDMWQGVPHRIEDLLEPYIQIGLA